MWPFKKKTPDVIWPFVEKRKVTLIAKNGSHSAVDYVPVEHLDAYVQDAQKRWGQVIVGMRHDSGPGGDNQPPANLNHLYGVE